MNQPTDKQIQWFWEQCGLSPIKMRGGFWDEGGYFCEMESNPYSPKERELKELCYLVESRDLTVKELEAYQRDFDKGIAKWMPTKAEFWEAVPPLDLNNLFKYAVSLLYFFELKKRDNKFVVGARMSLGNTYYTESEKPEDAIFGAIYKALGGKE